MLPSEDEMFVENPSVGEIFVEKCKAYRRTPGRGEIFVEIGCTQGPTHSVGEIFFYTLFVSP